MTWSRVKPRSQVHGSSHATARKQWALRHHEDDPCVRCGHALGPMGPWLHLDHDDYDKTRYRGFAHGSAPCPVCKKRCNLRAAALLGNARQKRERTNVASTLRW